MIHPRILQMQDFYRSPNKVCSFMSPDITRFVLLPKKYTASELGAPLLEYVQSKTPLALSYVWEEDPISLQQERTTTLSFFTDAMKVLSEAQHHRQINRRELEQEVIHAFSRKVDTLPFLSYFEQGFYTIAMSPKHTARYAPCFSMVLTRITDVEMISTPLTQAIRARATERMGRPYDAKLLYIFPKGKR